MAICMYNEYARAERASANEAYLAAPGFTALEAAARDKGFRKATLSEIHASAECHTFAEELFCWRGGLWVAT